MSAVPAGVTGSSYRVPAVRLDGTPVAGFAAFTDHLSYLPFSGSVLSQLADQLQGYTMTKSSLHFPVNRPLPKELVQKLIAVRLAERALLAVTDHVNLFLYDYAIVPDPEGIITSPASIRTRPRERALRQGETLNALPLSATLTQIIANNRAGGWRKLKSS